MECIAIMAHITLDPFKQLGVESQPHTHTFIDNYIYKDIAKVRLLELSHSEGQSVFVQIHAGKRFRSLLLSLACDVCRPFLLEWEVGALFWHCPGFGVFGTVLAGTTGGNEQRYANLDLQHGCVSKLGSYNSTKPLFSCTEKPSVDRPISRHIQIRHEKDRTLRWSSDFGDSTMSSSKKGLTLCNAPCRHRVSWAMGMNRGQRRVLYCNYLVKPNCQVYPSIVSSWLLVNNVSPLWVLLAIHLRWRGCGYSLAIPACFFGCRDALMMLTRRCPTNWEAMEMLDSASSWCRCNLYCSHCSRSVWGFLAYIISLRLLCGIRTNSWKKWVAMTCCPLLI